MLTADDLQHYLIWESLEGVLGRATSIHGACWAHTGVKALMMRRRN